jgi:hypothetical protein
MNDKWAAVIEDARAAGAGAAIDWSDGDGLARLEAAQRRHHARAVLAADAGLRVVTAAGLLEESDAEVEWLVDGLLPRAGLAILAGDPKSFKSMLALEIAVAVSSAADGIVGRSLLHGPVLFVEEEGSRGKFRDRLRSMLHAIEQDPPDNLYCAMHAGVRLDDAASMAALEELVNGVRPVLVVFDPLAAIHGAGESKNDEMARVLRPLARLAARNQFLALVIHHTTKPQADRKGTRLAQRIRGAGELAAVGDANIIMDREDERVRVRAEFRDAEPIDFWLVFDPERFLLVPSDSPARPGPASKVPDDAYIAHVAASKRATVNGTAAALGVSRSTAWSALFRLTDQGRLGHREDRGAHIFEVSE